MPSKDPLKLRAAQDRYRERHAERIKERKRAAYRADPQKHRARSDRYRRENADKVRPKWNAYQRQRRERLRGEMLAAYGNACACCGETEQAFLQLDHVNGGGRQHILRLKGATVELYNSLKKEGWPKAEYQLLCANCNWGRQREGGLCPHQRKLLTLKGR